MATKVTLIGERQARVGYRFLFEGVPELCGECKVKEACLENLELGRLYEVRRASNKRFSCILHSEKAVMVEVEEPLIETAVQARIAVNDALIEYAKLDCTSVSCEHRVKCSPTGLVEGDKCKIVDVKGSLKCDIGLQLAIVSLQRRPEAPIARASILKLHKQ